VNVGSVAVMAVTLLSLSKDAIVSLPAAGGAILALGILARFRCNSAWLVAGGALCGYLFG